MSNFTQAREAVVARILEGDGGRLTPCAEPRSITLQSPSR
jgi:hypothetical protein